VLGPRTMLAEERAAEFEEAELCAIRFIRSHNVHA